MISPSSDHDQPFNKRGCGKHLPNRLSEALRLAKNTNILNLAPKVDAYDKNVAASDLILGLWRLDHGQKGADRSHWHKVGGSW